MTAWTLVVLLYIGRSSTVVPNLPDRGACEQLGREVAAEATQGAWGNSAPRFWCVETAVR